MEFRIPHVVVVCEAVAVESKCRCGPPRTCLQIFPFRYRSKIQIS